MFSPFDYPEVKILFNKLLNTILEESERGAIIIGASSVEDHLTAYIEEVLPKKEESYKKKLLNYPGPLSSFSSKIELSFAFRLIDKNLYESLNSLRLLRNEASHRATNFSLKEFRDKLDKVFDLGPSVQTHVRNMSTEVMINLKLESLKYLFDKYELTEDQRREYLVSLTEDKELMAKIENQIPHWELIYGLSLICGLISYQKTKYKDKTGQNNKSKDTK